MSSKDYYASLWDTAEELNRNDCFNDLAYRNMTFDRDDRPEHILSKAALALFRAVYGNVVEGYPMTLFDGGLNDCKRIFAGQR